MKGKLFPTFGLTAETEFFLVETETGHETTIIEHDCDFCYYILEGQGYFKIEDTKEECFPGNLVVIPSGTKFTYKGRLKMLATSTPPWEEEQEETIL